MTHEIIGEMEDEVFKELGLEGCREVIRCRDCKHYEDYRCELLDYLYTRPNFYCAWGERNTD